MLLKMLPIEKETSRPTTTGNKMIKGEQPDSEPQHHIVESAAST